MAQEQDVEATYIKKSGKQLLNGLQAVSFSRIRHVATVNGVNNDYGRTDRQRLVMNQLFNKALTLSPGELTKLVKTCLPLSRVTLLLFLPLVPLPSFLRRRPHPAEGHLRKRGDRSAYG